MASTDVRDSPYIANWDVVPPSPSSAPIDLDHSSPFEQVFNVPDSINQAINPLTSPILPHTPSYNGSYYNSPFSNHSELAELDFFHDFPSNTTANSGLNPEYEPSEYDAPNQGNSLLIFQNEAGFMSPHLSPNNSGPDGLRTRGSPFDHGSPASSTGIDDNHHGRHSRASSISSNHGSPSAQVPNTHSPQASFQPSPRLEVINSFGNMTVHTPNWGTQPLPSHSPRIGKESLQQKPQSPPRLTMPSAMTFASEATAVPKINAPDADDGGPAFNIVPATPVAIRDANGRQHLPFQQTLGTLSQGVELVTSDSGMTEQQQGQKSTSPYGSPHADALSGDFFFPEAQLRQRRNSDSWLDRSFADNSQGQLELNDNTYAFPQQPQAPQSVDDQHRQQLQAFTFGRNITGGFFPNSGDSICRSASDSLAAPRLVHNKSRSEEIRFVPPPSLQAHHPQSNSISGTGGFLFPPTSHSDFLQRQQQQFLHPNDLPVQSSSPGLQPSRGRRSLSPGHLRRASSGSRSERGAEVWNRQPNQFQPTQTGIRRMSPYPTPNASPGVHYSELEELGAGMGLGGLAETNMGLGAGLGLGLSVGVSSLGVEGIPGIGEPPISAGYSEEVAIAGRNSYNHGVDAASSHGGHGRAESAASLAAIANDPNLAQGLIAKQNVTTGRTANASIRRRKQEANFVCTVPGCGSTFTRGFNLKGHMRSHYEQKPYKCHWPGCDKGFARQHDCKRHEQLHSNYRPFVCEGCNKNFARMDALNRHLKSEAGAECAKAVEGKRAGGAGMVSGMLEGDDLMDDDEKPIVEKLPIPRRRNTNNGFNNPAGISVSTDDMWSVAL